MTIVRETVITIDRQREITVNVHDQGAVTMSVEDPGAITIVEIPAGQLAELHAAISDALGDDPSVRMLLDGLEVETIAELKRLVVAGQAVDDIVANTLRDAGVDPDTFEPLASLPALGRLEPDDEPRPVIRDGARAFRDGDGELRDVHPLELLDEPDGVLESMAAGDLEVTDKTRHLAQAELDYRRAQAQR